MAGPEREAAAGLVVADKFSEQVYWLLRGRIVRGGLRPDSRIDLPALMAELGISKTPLRQALARLELDGLVTTRARSGTYVSTLTLNDIREVCDVRLGIEWVATLRATGAVPADVLQELRAEVVAAEAAAGSGDYEPFFASDTRLHTTIMEYAGNERLRRARAGVEGYIEWMQVVGATGAHRIRGASQRHLAILDAMIAGDAERARDEAAVHVGEVRAWTLEDFAALYGETYRGPATAPGRALR
ncbi:GntR family transcriptional regulator [Nocardiopsis mangrovi]|uniref:GntR family transcriptional regulator n=1 Tax=Nocardiopsis mangrovi TaxID=1179818 RepID=A0ABV9DU64_9ACTN